MGSNPAGRLHAALTKALQGQPKEITRDTWARVFGTDPSDTGAILHGLSILIQQIALAKERVLTVEGVDQNLYLRPLEAVEGAFSEVNLGEQLGNVKARLGTSTMATLEYTSEFLRLQYPSADLPEKTRAALLKKVEAMATDIRSAEIEPRLKQVLVEHVERLRRALIEYEIRGPEGLLDSLDLNLGFVIRTGVETSDPDETGVLRKMGANLIAFYNTVSAALGLAKIAAGPLKDLLKLSSGG